MDMTWVWPRVNTADAMRAGQDARFAPDGANLGQRTAVGTNAVVDDLAAHDFLVEVIQRIGNLALALREGLSKVLEGFLP